MAKSYLNRNDLPRGIRNNNPGNIRYSSRNNWLGKIPFQQNLDADRAFEQFKELRFGIRAKMILIYNDLAAGKTITQLIHEFAPPFENNTTAYINTVATQTKLPVNAKIVLTEDNLLKIAKAINRVENGTQNEKYITDQDWKDGLAIFDKPLLKKKVA